MVARWWLITGMLFLSLLCCGCGKAEEREPGKVFSQAAVVYEGEVPVLFYAVDEEGLLYTVGIRNDGEERYCLCQYDKEQKLQQQYLFDSSFMGIGAIAAEGRTVYFTGSRGQTGNPAGISLCALNLDTEEIEVLADYSFYETVRQMLLQDGCLYLLGAREYSGSAEQPSGSDGCSFYGDRLIYYRIEEKESYAIGLEYPIAMAPTGDGSLMIHAYVDGEGYQMLQYDPAQDSLQTVAEFDCYQVKDFAFCHDGKDLIYSYRYDSRGLVLAALDDLNSETELCPDKLISLAGTKVFYQDEEVYLLNQENSVMRFALADVYRGNVAIRYISPGYEIDAPYGCGYTMQREELDEDKFALKVLAQDSDYDLCLIDSIYSSYNLRKNGVFYPLNDVPGVEEYLERCFPYVKEAAVKDDGTVWMLPIAVYMPGLIVQEETLSELGIALQRGMTWTEFASLAAAVTSEEKELISLSRVVCAMLFFQQYFERYESIDQALFRENAAALQKIAGDMWLAPCREDRRYLFYYIRYMGDYTNPFLKEYYYGADAKVYPMPNLSAGDVNTATCILLAVNPASDHRNETLDFIADYVAWQMAEEEAPLFFKEPVPEAGSFEAEVYELYRNGEIAFTVDEDVYMDGFYEMLNGEKDLEEYIRETERKLRIYLGE